MEQSFLDQFAQNFRHSNQQTPLIVYDVDDILWGLMPRIAARGRLDPQICYALFDLSNNEQLSPDERDYIITSFADADIFRDINFYPGIDQLLRPQELGAKVKINSNCYSHDIAELKITQLLRAIPELTSADIQVNVIDHSQTTRKPLDPTTTILIDDSPHNIANSPALLNIMPSYVAWSSHPSAKQQVQHQSVIWQPSLEAINNFVYQAVEHLLN